MKLKIDENSSNYPCTVVQIKELYEIPNADNLNRVVLLGNNVIVSKDVKEGDVMLYFVAGTQLSQDLCYHNNLLDDSALNKDTTERGYVSSKRRLIKALKLRGTISDGMLLPLQALSYLEDGKLDPKGFLKVGDTFTHLGDVEVCKKYEVPVKQSGTPGSKTPKENKLKDLLIKNQFRFHTNTSHFARNIELFTPSTELIITRKYHGSSLILAHVLINKKLKWYEKLFSRFTNIPKSEYGYVYSSGKPKSRLPKGIESEGVDWKSHTQSFYSDDIWKRAYESYKDFVEKGITLYGEIVGQGIQGGDYTYGFDYKILIYRITSTNPDGQVQELSWEAVKKYCEKYGLKYVDEYFVGKVSEVVGKQGTSEDLLQRLQEAYLDKSYPDCDTDEGVCIRVRGTDEIYKLKSPKFIAGESAELEKGIENES